MQFVIPQNKVENEDETGGSDLFYNWTCVIRPKPYSF